MKHTPGPWKVITNNLVRDSHGNCIHGDSSFIRNEANARLIAAAPELLELVKYSLDCLVDDKKTAEEFKKLIAKVEGKENV